MENPIKTSVIVSANYPFSLDANNILYLYHSHFFHKAQMKTFN